MLRDNRPTVFLSSTVHDFRDLRSALRYWLEESGFQLRFSEFNDFPQAPDRNSYDSCLRAIDDSDYFVLLVGGRVGGRVGPDGVSITRLEYRHAYERLTKGLIKIVPLVRKEVWDSREDRRGLEAYLRAEAGLDPDAAKRAALHPSKLVEDAEHVFDFLNEITRNHEMKGAAGGATPLPIGNWVYQFSSFRDIADALRTVMGVRGHLRRAALAANLKLEIARNLRRLYTGRGSEWSPVTSWSGPARTRFGGEWSGSSTYQGKTLCWLGIFMIECSMAAKLDRFALGKALTSGEFLDFDPHADRYEAGKLQQALLDMAERIDSVGTTMGMKNWLETQEYVIDRFKKAGGEEYTVANERLIPAFVVHDRLHDLHELFRAVYKALDGDGALLDGLNLRPMSPLASEATKIEAGQPRLEDVVRFLDGRTNRVE